MYYEIKHEVDLMLSVAKSFYYSENDKFEIILKQCVYGVNDTHREQIDAFITDYYQTFRECYDIKEKIDNRNAVISVLRKCYKLDYDLQILLDNMKTEINILSEEKDKLGISKIIRDFVYNVLSNSD